MNIASIRPSTVDGIKQLAKKIRRERNLTHTIALDEASRQAGYENFVHARRQIGQQLVHLYLSAHWRSWGTVPRSYAAGLEILRLDLNRPLLEIIAKHRVPYARGLGRFRMEYTDHLELQIDLGGQDEARKVLLTAARSVRFMEATGLQPVTTQQQRQRLRTLFGVPGHDHQSEWFDPASGACLMLDEPYAPALRKVADERRAWLADNNLYEVAPDWEGIYYPGECLPRLLGDDAEFLKRIATILANVAPFPEPASWPHETAPYRDDFISPQRKADAKPRRPRPGPSWKEHKGAVPYGGAPGFPSKWRPKKAMPFELHQQLGQLMSGVRSSGFTYRVDIKLTRAHNRLEDWAIIEHQHEHPDAVYDVYFGPNRAPACDTNAKRMDALTKARAIVEQGYDDCKPRRELLAALDAGIAEVEKNLKLNQ